MQLNQKEIAAACEGQWIQGEDQNLEALRFSTDTRLLKAGEFFVALKGENFDGHQFLEQALEKGAGGLIVEKWPAGEKAPAVAVYETPDSLRALGDLAAAWRKKCNAHRTAVVGSSGKTTTKEMLASILRHCFGKGAEGNAQTQTVLASRGNWNNLIGVPLTLFEMQECHRWAVLEMGMNEEGELARLTRIADPQLLVFLNVGTAHIGQFGSQEKLVHAKGEAVRNLSKDARILYDVDSPNTRHIIRQWGGERPALSFGVERSADFSVESIRSDRRHGYHFDLLLGSNRVPVHLPMFGRHNVSNALAAAAAAHLMGVDGDCIQGALCNFHSSQMRSETREINGVTLVVDCYNANPESMGSGLESIQDWKEKKGRILLVLGEMLELGAASEEAHRELARQAAALEPEAVYLYGESMKAFAEAWPAHGGTLMHGKRHEDLARDLTNRIRKNDLVFVKGSRGCRLEIVVEFLEKYLESAPLEG